MSQKAGSPRNAHSGFSNALNTHFPGSHKECEFVNVFADQLSKRGFNAENSIACVGICRDEICRTLEDEVSKKYGDCFSVRGLGGFIFCGRTGFGAAHAHSPLISGRDKYVYVVAPHIGISADGVLGECTREGRDKLSHACGALAAFHGKLLKGSVSTQLCMKDLEMSAMSQLLVENIPWGSEPDLAGLTKIAANVIVTKQLEDIIQATVNTSKADYAVISGVQIHGPGLKESYFYPLTDLCYSVVDGKKEMVNVSTSY
jgi:hypothetical protein